MKTIKTEGTYTAPDKVTEVTYAFEYAQIDSLQDAVDNLGAEKAQALIQRMLKVDANNTAREKARVENGHSLRKPMTEAEKAEAKAKRKEKDAVYAVLKARGLSLEDLENLVK